MKSNTSVSSFLLLFIAILAQGCSMSIELSSKKKPKTHLRALHVHRQYTITSDDKLSISIWNNEDLSIGSVFGIYNSNEVYGKWIMVDKRGKVDLPKIGRIKIGGLTCSQAADTLRSHYAREIVDPVIVVKVLNKEVTVLGEVNDPGTILLDKEFNGFMEVIGKAGGLTDYARERQVKLIRKTNGTSHEFTIDLKKEPSWSLNKIQVRPGDIIQIPTGKGKKLEKKLPLLIPLTSLLTGVAVLVSVLPRNN